MAYPERIIPDETEVGIVAVHAARYEFALPWCEGRDVLDAACGVGYGSAILHRVARQVIGVDRSGDAVAYARGRYARDGVKFETMDVTALKADAGSFDVVCSFETLEHVDDPELAVAEAARVLRSGGTYIVSTPHVAVTTRTPANPHHQVEFSRDDLEALLRRFFPSVTLYGQRRLTTARHRIAQRLDVLGLRRRFPLLRRLGAAAVGTHAVDEVTASDIAIAQDGIEHATELVAVCHLA
ncbi:MAG: Methyltransferase type 11 [bacterium]|jgi:SAM-dependent methyltransferase|nr:Methyltransferase type 11 [bacterium]